MSKEFFTAEELPPGFVMAVTKLPSGEEAATVFRLDDSKERKENALNMLVDLVRSREGSQHG